MEKEVPQGSIFGSIIFILYINDIETIIKKYNIILYADDTLIYADGEN